MRREAAAVARASGALSGFLPRAGCHVPAWKFTAAAAAGCPGSLRYPDVGAGASGPQTWPLPTELFTLAGGSILLMNPCKW